MLIIVNDVVDSYNSNQLVGMGLCKLVDGNVCEFCIYV